MVKAKHSKGKKKDEQPKDLYEVFPGLRFTVNYKDIKGGSFTDTGQAFTLTTVDDCEEVIDVDFTNFQMITNRSFTYKEALKLSAALAEAINAVDALKKQFAKLDEINCYIDSMKSTVDDYRREITEDFDNMDAALDLDGDIRDLEESLKDF